MGLVYSKVERIRSSEGGQCSQTSPLAKNTLHSGQRSERPVSRERLEACRYLKGASTTGKAVGNFSARPNIQKMLRKRAAGMK